VDVGAEVESLCVGPSGLRKSFDVAIAILQLALLKSLEF